MRNHSGLLIRVIVAEAAMPIIYRGIDSSGIARVYGEATTDHEAFAQCRQAVIEYVRRRPDTAPMSAWLIEAV